VRQDREQEEGNNKVLSPLQEQGCPRQKGMFLGGVEGGGGEGGEERGGEGGEEGGGEGGGTPTFVYFIRISM
jgi:hypothetical protein